MLPYGAERRLMSMRMKSKSTSMRVSVALRDRIATIARQEGRSMTEVLADAITQYEYKMWWQELNATIERTQRDDPDSWAAYIAERDLLMGPPSDRIAPEWEGLIDMPEEGE
jgi:predicted transcriptional regulator